MHNNDLRNPAEITRCISDAVTGDSHRPNKSVIRVRVPTIDGMSAGFRKSFCAFLERAPGAPAFFVSIACHFYVSGRYALPTAHPHKKTR